MSLTQAITNVRWLPGLSAGTGNGNQQFVFPMLRQLGGNAGLSLSMDGGMPAVWRAMWDAPSTVVFNPVVVPTVRVGGIWVLRETVNALDRPPWSQLPLDIARAAVKRGLSRMAELPQGVYTQHALMVPWGEFAHEIGLIQKLSQVPIPQKSIVHVPQAKVLTFLMGILTGITHLKDLNEGPHPLAHDWAAIRAWGLVALAHYSGVSRTLASCDQETVEAIVQVLDEISQPFVDQEVRLLRQRNSPLIIDLDLAPRRVSDTSTTFPDAEFGWQGSAVGLGYDAALAALTSPTYGRLFLAGFHHPRNTVSLPRLQKMVRAVESRLSLRPRRRTELVEQRRQELEETLSQRQGRLAAQLDKQKALMAQLETLPEEVARLEVEVTALEAIYRARDREEKPHSQLAKARRRLTAAQRKLERVHRYLQQAQRATATHQKRLERLQTDHTELTAHLAQLQADNESNPDPVTIILRIDAGFGSGPNITWLVEMGYIIYTKARNAQVAAKLKAMVKPDTRWTQVGRNAEMTAWGEQSINNCPYPLTVALERFHTPDGLKHSALITYRDDGQTLTLPAWFDFYNGRQTIEAGIKESNVVFKMHPLKVRSRGGILLQEQFSLFATNFVRWAAVWLGERVSRSDRRFDDALTRVKAMVRVGANTSAWVVGEDESLLVKFDETGAYPGVELRLVGAWRIYPPILPRKKVHDFDFADESAPGCT
jgi:hypothetical protein